jgi:hypothetical protein
MTFKKYFTVISMIAFFYSGFLFAQDEEDDVFTDTETSISSFSFQTVKDSKTGLIWQKCSFGQDSSTCSGDAGIFLWTTALSHCKKLNEQSGTTGISNWRLPNTNELKSLLDRTKNPKINSSLFPGTSTARSYWTSTTYKNSPSLAWVLDFNNGLMNSAHKTENAEGAMKHVRCVAGP